jgi:hypothetical protein
VQEHLGTLALLDVGWWFLSCNVFGFCSRNSMLDSWTHVTSVAKVATISETVYHSDLAASAHALRTLPSFKASKLYPALHDERHQNIACQGCCRRPPTVLENLIGYVAASHILCLLLYSPSIS